MPQGLDTDLVGLGVPAKLAERQGVVNPITKAGATTAQATATALAGSTFVLGTTAGGQTAFLLSSSYPLWREFHFYNMSSTAALIFPPSGGTIDNGSGDASVSVAQNRGRMFLRTGTNSWISFYGA